MNDTWKEKIINDCSYQIKRHPLLKPLITLYLIFMLMLINICSLISSNAKKLVSMGVLVIFYMISCSFCAPVFILQTEEVQTEEQIGEIHDIYLAENTDTTNETELNLEKGTKYQNPEVDGNDDIENYSIDEILENNLDYQLKDQLNESNENQWKVMLINKQHPIPEDYEFQLGTITGNLQCDERIIPELLEMLQRAKDDGISLLICSPYRDLGRQQMLFNRKINNYMGKGLSYMESYKLASQAVTIPGSSEHQVGLALDIYTDSYKALDSGFGETPAGMWLANHCSEYGFILRYPKEKEYITGIEYEPWHFRYVGKDAAAIMAAENLTLEEYNENY